MLREESIAVAGVGGMQRRLGGCSPTLKSGLVPVPEAEGVTRFCRSHSQGIREKVVFFLLAGNLKTENLKEKVPNTQWSAPAMGDSGSNCPSSAELLGHPLPSPEAAPLHPDPCGGDCRRGSLSGGRFCIRGQKWVLTPIAFLLGTIWCKMVQTLTP